MDHSPPETRECANCNNQVQVDPLHWAFKNGKPLGICLACRSARVAEQTERVLKAAIEAEAAGTSAEAKPKAQRQRKAADAKPAETKTEIVAASKLEAAAALKVGARVLNEHAAFVMAKVLEYASTPEHKHHLWAIEFLAQRIMPRKLYEELGGQAAGVGALSDRRPQFVLNILPASPDAPQGAVYENEPLALPAPTAVQIIEERKDEPHP